jgi:hypothetical protein
MNQLAAHRPNATATDDLAGLRIRQQFHETIQRCLMRDLPWY